MSRGIPLPTAILLVGQHTVIRRAIRGTPHNTYTVMFGRSPVWTIMSHPSEEDCAAAIRIHCGMTSLTPAKRGRPARGNFNGAVRAARPAA
ncbi:hypothetical protein [Cupriavidus plantarum]|uniref:hypothetical protein n=1 Tax=Cupriavidus plantarum TaxID=942865 RepID=UPI000EB2476D|nr:hypothetical protein [Cupriavidus plantarum]RLK45970.1 hypothetical protein C7417_2001 [Cupriavidus plantarum]